MKILITGGGGYVGSLLVDRLLADNHKLVVLDTFWFGNNLHKHKNIKIIEADIREKDTYNYLDEDIDVVFHLLKGYTYSICCTKSNSSSVVFLY